MENASKALIIAGAVLVAMMILTIGVFLVGRLGSASDSYVSTLDSTALQKYNSSFEVFIGREDISAQEIITLINLTEQSHQDTTVEIDGVNTKNWVKDLTKDERERKKNEILEKSNEAIRDNDSTTTGLYKYVDIDWYDESGKVKIIKFQKK